MIGATASIRDAISQTGIAFRERAFHVAQELRALARKAPPSLPERYPRH